MTKSLDVAEFLKKSESLPIIDVRSPAEFEQGHIPNAVNIPLFEDNERALVGTRYKQVGQESAFLLGLDIVGTKLSGFVKKAKKISPENEVLVHCWRGGMRSGSFGILLASAGMKVSTLKGGYKNYRNHVLQTFFEPLKIIILGGKTGSGKTEILKELEKKGEQILDLEGIAHHKGSSFGTIGQKPQPSSENFENNLYHALSQLDFSQRIWIEDESKHVGKCFIPQGLWQQMRTAPVAFVDIPKELRIKRLVHEYAQFPKEELKEATDRILTRLGGQHHKKAIEALENGDFSVGCDIALTYYDKAYLHGLTKRENLQIFNFETETDEPEKMAETLSELQF